MYALEDEGSEGINEYVLHLASEFLTFGFSFPEAFRGHELGIIAATCCLVVHLSCSGVDNGFKMQ
jgi:hypothetical protein